MRVALAAHALIGPDSPPPQPALLAEAEQTYRLSQLVAGGFVMANSMEEFRAHQLLATVQPVYDFLVSTMNSSQPHHQRVADAFVREAGFAGTKDSAFQPWVPVALLVKAAHFAQGGRLVEALRAVEQATSGLGSARAVSREARKVVRDQGAAAQRVLIAAIARQPMTESKRAELDDAWYDLDVKGRKLLDRGDLVEATDVFDRALAFASEWHGSFSNDARAIRAVATTHCNRLICLIEMEQHADAVPGALLAVRLFSSLRSTILERTPVDAAVADTEVRLAVALAGAALEGTPQSAEPDLVAAVTYHGDAAVEAWRRLAEQDAAEKYKLGRALALYGRALRLLELIREDPAVSAAMLAADTEALQIFRNIDKLDINDRRYFAEIAFAHALCQLHEDHEAASIAATDFIDQAQHLLLTGVWQRYGSTKEHWLEQVGYAQYIAGVSKLQLSDASCGQHFVDAQYLLDQHPGPLPEPIARVKGEIDEFISRH